MLNHRNYAIEPMTGADIAAIERLESEGGLTHWGADCYRRDLGRTEFILLVARLQPGLAQAGEIAGFLNAWLVADEFQLNNLAVSAAWRRCGIGSALLEAALRQARAQGAVRGVLDVRAANVAAQALYQSLGFRTVGVRKNCYHHPSDDALLMAAQLRLSGAVRPPL